MAKPLRPKRGTTAKNDAFTGLASEITIDTEKHSIRVHDNVTAGGHEILPKAKNDELYEGKGVALPKTGGAMEGNIVGNKDKISELVVSSGIGWTGGDATLYMYNANAGDDHGKFRLVAGHHEVFTALEGSPDGSLTWKGDGVITSAGGKINGLVRYSTLFPVTAETDDMRIHICGGYNWNTGAHLVLTGKDESGNGAFELVCQNSDVRIQLQGRPNGALTWDDKEVEQVNTQNFTSKLSFHRWDSGIQVVWGHSLHDDVVTLPAPFFNDAYVAVGTLNRPQGQDQTGAANAIVGTFIEKSATGFKVLAINAMNDSWANDGSYISWMAVGRWK